MIQLRYQSRQAPAADEDLFRYTSGRWIFNEHLRLKERERVFDVDALKRIAAKSVSRDSSDLLSVRKIAEGSSYRSILTRIREAPSLLARIPYSSTTPASLAVAGEVALLRLLRKRGIPVPKVFGYATDTDNEIGCEYILVEHIEGEKLSELWDDLPVEDARKVIAQIVDIEKRILNLQFPASGSVYQTADLPPDMRREMVVDETGHASEFCIGPDNRKHFWSGQRSALDIDRGPFTTSRAVLLAGAKKEHAWLTTYGQPLRPMLRGRRKCLGYRKQRPEVHARSLELYSSMVTSFIPEDQALCRPTLRCSDLYPRDIIVDADLNIEAIVGWPDCTVLPLFLQDYIPNFIRWHDDEFSGTEAPPAPVWYEDEDDYRAELEIYRCRMAHYNYMRLARAHNMLEWTGITQIAHEAARELYNSANAPWQGDNISLRGLLAVMNEVWHIYMPATSHSPIKFLKKELSLWARRAERQTLYDLVASNIDRCGYGMTPDGWVENGRYDEVVTELAERKLEWLQEAETDKERTLITDNWRYDDFDETPYQ